MKIACPKCKTLFDWSPQIAGKKIGCKCGKVFLAPKAQTAPKADEYDLAEDEVLLEPVTEPAPAATPPPSPVARVPAPTPAMAASPMYAYARQRDQTVLDDEDPDGGPFKSLYAPGILLLAGVLMAGVHVANQAQLVTQGKTMGVAVGLLICQVVLAVATMFVGVFMSAQILSINFGSIGRTIWKLTAIAVFAVSLAVLVASMDKDKHSIVGWAIAWNLALLVYWATFSFFWKNELHENLLTVSIVAFTQALGFCVLLSL